MKTFSHFLLTAFIAITCISCKTAKENSCNEIEFADPTIFVENGKYYLTGTRNRAPEGFALLESTDLKTWKTVNGDTLALILRKGDSCFGDKGFWAPQIFKEKDTYYLTYTANEQTVLATGKSVSGPFRQDSIQPIDGSEKNIDSFLFKDSDGTYYLYHVRFGRGNYLWVAEFDLQKGCIKPETLKKCFGCTEDWEHTPAYQSDPIMEGPTVVKLDNVYYLFYSANHFMSVDYAVGYATATSPYGPWVKHANSPIIHRNIVGEKGSGHGDLFKGLDGQYYYVFHVHHSDSVVSPRKTRIVPLNFEKMDNGIYSITADKKHVITPIQE